MTYNSNAIRDQFQTGQVQSRVVCLTKFVIPMASNHHTRMFSNEAKRQAKLYRKLRT